MRPLALIEFLSLDGVMQSLGSPDEDTDGGFRHGGWARPYGDPVLFGSAAEGLASTDAYLFGRRTYEKMAAFWPHQPDTDPMAASLNAHPKYVASRTLRALEWRNAELLTGDVPEAVAELKGRPGGRIAVLGSGLLAQTLMAHDLVDEYELFVHPLVLGGGKRLFRDAPDVRRLELVRATPTTTGVLLLSYRPVRGAA
jgi:dihydrofolate reductase